MRKRIVGFLLAMVLLLYAVPYTGTAEAASLIPNDAVEYNGHWYKVYDLDNVTNWDAAKSFCESKGGYLASITSQEENDFVYGYLHNTLGLSNAYFGLTDKDNEGTWVWSNGETVNYTNWHSGEPNYESSNEDFAMFYWKFTDGTWNDGDFFRNTNSGGKAFICEWGDYSLNVPVDTGVYNNHTYKLFDISMTWTEAKSYCEQVGGHLLTVSDKQESDFVVSLLNCHINSKNCYWIGLRKDTSSKWSWVTNENLVFSNWTRNEPNNQNRVEQYAHLFGKEYGSLKHVGQWNDASNDGAPYANDFYKISNFGFICEWETFDNVSSISISCINSSKYAIHVTDNNGNSIPNANVTWQFENNSASAVTDANGMAYFNRFTAGDPTITVTKNGYTTWSNANTNWSKNDNHFDTVVLYPSGLGSFKLVSAKYTNSKTASQSGYDILTKTKKLSLGNDASLTGDLDFGNFSLSVRAIDTSNVQKYVLYQNNNLIAESTSGDFNKLNTERFSEGGGCFVRVYSKNGDKVDTNINLEFSKEEVNKTSELSIGADGISIAVGDSVPFLGGSTFSLELPIKPKITTKMSDTKIQFGFNLDLDEKSEDEQFEKAQKTIDEMKSVSKAYGMLTKQTFKSLAKEKNKADFFGDDCLEVTVLGYAEADLGSSTAKGTIIVEVSIKAVELEYNTVIVVVPVTVQTELTLNGQLSVDASYDWKNATLLGEFNGNIKPKLKAFGGVGFSRLVGVGAYGSAELDVAFHILPKPVYCRYVDLTGELGLKAYVGLLKYEKPFAHNTWHLYTAPNVASIAAAQDIGEPWYSGIYDSSQYTPDDLSYLAEESQWRGGTAVLMSGEAKTQLTPLLTDTYRNAQPVMISSGGSIYAAFVRADAETGERYIACTKSDGLTWSEPVRIDGNAVLDDAPTLCADNSGSIWLAYARTDPNWSGESLTAYAESQSIVVGRLDPDTLKFTEGAVYNGDGYVHMQKMAVVDGVPALAWYDSAVTDDDSVLLPESGSIRTAIYENGKWSVKRRVPVDSAVKSLTVGTVEGEIAVGFVSDDMLFAARTDGTVTKLAENVTGSVSYGMLPGSDESDFIWNGGGQLVTAGGSSVEIEGITNEYAIIGDCVYYSKATENGAVLALTKYTANSGWGSPIQLTDGERYLENLSVADLNGHDFVMGMNTDAVITEEGVEDSKDLVWSVVMPVSDLIIEGVECSRDGLSSGEDVQVTVTVTNGGDHTADGVELTLNGTQTVVDTTGLNSGESREYVINMTCPDKLTEYSLSVSETDRDDYNPDDNEYTFSLGQGDAAVELELIQIGESKTVLATVKNEGIDTISGTALLYDSNGEAAAVSTFGPIAAGEITVIQYRLTEDFVGFSGGDVTVELNTSGEDLYSYNNTDTIHIMETVRETAIEYLIVEDGTVRASIFCAEDSEAKAFCAAYDETGKMVSVSFEVLTANKVNELTFAVPSIADSVKVYVLDVASKPLCVNKELKLG